MGIVAYYKVRLFLARRGEEARTVKIRRPIRFDW